MMNLIPKPVSAVLSEGEFVLTAQTRIIVQPGEPEVAAVGHHLAEYLRPATGFPLPVMTGVGNAHGGNIYLTTIEADPTLGDEGYTLWASPGAVILKAARPVGLFWGVQTLRQLLPPGIEGRAPQPGAWRIPACEIRDQPRFAWRGAMLDVARHFFGIADVFRMIDLLAYYKLNRFHLHLTDDQGWRIEIKSWPRLATHGGTTAVGGSPGGYFTQAEYAEVVAYAQSRYITVVPEIDMPSHINAALASYPQLNREGQAPDLYTGIEVGFSTLCLDKEITYRFIGDVLAEVAALTPGPYLHIGGDEAHSTELSDYMAFIERLQPIVQTLGKQMIGWQEITRASLNPDTLVQFWKEGLDIHAAEQGVKVILSPGSRIYLDMKYTPKTKLGLTWAGTLEVQDAYDWEPAAYLPSLPESAILGVETALWSETVQTLADIEFMAFPRLIGAAEIGWSPIREWQEYRRRLATHGPRLEALGVNFYRSPQVDWE